MPILSAQCFYNCLCILHHKSHLLPPCGLYKEVNCASDTKLFQIDFFRVATIPLLIDLCGAIRELDSGRCRVYTYFVIGDGVPLNEPPLIWLMTPATRVSAPVG